MVAGTFLPPRIGLCRSAVKAFIQNVHHFRDDTLRDPAPPDDHVVVFDEAQRAWDARQLASFMKRKKGRLFREPVVLGNPDDKERRNRGFEIDAWHRPVGEWADSNGKKCTDAPYRVKPPRSRSPSSKRAASPFTRRSSPVRPRTGWHRV